jgi:hypothetical protein
MIVVQLDFGHGAGRIAIDPISALAQQIAGKQSLPVVRDDFSRLGFRSGVIKGAPFVSHAKVEIYLVETRFDFCRLNRHSRNEAGPSSQARNFSIVTSAVATSRGSSARPSSALRSMAKLRLLRLKVPKKPAANPDNRRNRIAADRLDLDHTGP